MMREFLLFYSVVVHPKHPWFRYSEDDLTQKKDTAGNEAGPANSQHINFVDPPESPSQKSAREDRDVGVISVDSSPEHSMAFISPTSTRAPSPSKNAAPADINRGLLRLSSRPSSPVPAPIPNSKLPPPPERTDSTTLPEDDAMSEGAPSTHKSAERAGPSHTRVHQAAVHGGRETMDVDMAVEDRHVHDVVPAIPAVTTAADKGKGREVPGRIICVFTSPVAYNKLQLSHIHRTCRWMMLLRRSRSPSLRRMNENIMLIWRLGRGC